MKIFCTLLLVLLFMLSLGLETSLLRLLTFWQLVFGEFTVTLVGFCECVLLCVPNNEQQLPLLLWGIFLDSCWFLHVSSIPMVTTVRSS